MKYILLICGDRRTWAEAKERYGELIYLAHRLLRAATIWMLILYGP